MGPYEWGKPRCNPFEWNSNERRYASKMSNRGGKCISGFVVIKMGCLNRDSPYYFNIFINIIS
jgi:hypothetical protein